MPKKFRTGDQALVRELNRTIILNELRTHSPQSRADLAAATGLNKTTISSLIAELLTAGLVREIENPIYATGVGLVKFGAQALAHAREGGATHVRAAPLRHTTEVQPQIQPAAKKVRFLQWLKAAF